MSQAVEFLSSVGRIVWGHPLNSQIKKDNKTKQPVMRDGKQVEQWVFGLAIPKDQFTANEWPNLHRAASLIFPHGVPAGFSWKYKDGDGVDKKGKPYSQREGWAGCYVLTISTEAFAPEVFKREGNGWKKLEPHEIKTGDFVRVTINAKANSPTDSSHTPGVYVNPKALEFIGYGSEIVGGGVDPDEAFATPVAQLPPGASATPIGGSNVPPGMAMPGAPQQPYAAPQAPQGYPAPAAPMAPPAHDFVQNAGMPQGAPPAPQAPQGYPAPAAAPAMGMPPGNFGAPGAGVPMSAPAPQAPVGYASGATTYPSNVPPGMPGAPQR